MTDTETIHQFAVQNMLVVRYLLGELSGADLEDFEQRLFECSICFEEARAGQEFKEGLAAGVSPRKSLWQRIREFFGTNTIVAAICCGAPLPPGTPTDRFFFVLGIFMAGAWLGVMLMALAQRYAKRRKRSEFERLGNSIGGAVPPRWNGRYPKDAERHP